MRREWRLKGGLCHGVVNLVTQGTATDDIGQDEVKTQSLVMKKLYFRKKIKGKFHGLCR